jgi:hypothetical protein
MVLMNKGLHRKNEQLIKAHLNLYAVLKNLEDLVSHDPDTARLVKKWDVSIAFNVLGGPKACVEFKDGCCTVGKGRCRRPPVILFFTSPAHLNRMMEGKANPIPLRGFTKLGFLKKDFTQLTDRLEYYLRPNEALLKDRHYLELNTRLTMSTAAFAVPELGRYDPIGRLAAGRAGNGAVNIKILAQGPAVHVIFRDETIQAGRGEVEQPAALMQMKDWQVANDFFNNKTDPFTAIASGDVIIKGRIPLLESLSLILDRIPHYLS